MTEEGVIRCGWCDTEFVRSSSAQKYCCKTCSIQAHRKAMNDAHKKRSLQHKEKPEKLKKKKGYDLTNYSYCKSCIYYYGYCKTYGYCDYLGKTGRLRGCPIGYCNKKRGKNDKDKRYQTV